LGLHRCFTAIRFVQWAWRLDQINKIKQEILANEEVPDSRPIRHRKVLVELVKQGGWIDERSLVYK